MKDCIKWFKDYDKKDKCSFVKYDMRKSYLSIMEKTVDEALNLAKEYIVIPEDKINIVKHCCKLLLYHDEDLWIKRVVVTLTTSWVHLTGHSCVSSWVAYCYTFSIILLTPVTMVFIETLGWLLYMIAHLEKQYNEEKIASIVL